MGGVLTHMPGRQRKPAAEQAASPAPAPEPEPQAPPPPENAILAPLRTEASATLGRTRALLQVTLRATQASRPPYGERCARPSAGL